MDTPRLLSAVEKLKTISFDEFKDVLNTMSNENFAAFVTYFYEYNGVDEYKIIPIGFNQNNTLLWVGYFAEDYGKANDEVSKQIIETILQNASTSDYLILKNNNANEAVFLKENELKETCFKNDIVQNIFKERNAWSEPMFDLYGNIQNNLFVTLINYSNYF